ncbi:MAG: hypothetical protein EBS66_16370 [Betaproteobacteria bacterium]|nr:hypothetical protein [Betaproteobacteria bacterium]
MHKRDIKEGWKVIALSRRIPPGLEEAICLPINLRDPSNPTADTRDETALLERSVREKWPVSIDFQERTTDWGELNQEFRVRHLANMIDPTFGQVPVISQLFSLLGTLVFLSVGGHLIVFGMLLESFQLFPIGKSLMTQDVMGKMLTWSSMMFLAALLIALPVVVTLLFVNVGMGFVTRAAPSLNIFSVGFPAMLIAGFLILWMATPSILVRINWLWIQTFQQMRGILTG